MRRLLIVAALLAMASAANAQAPAKTPATGAPAAAAPAPAQTGEALLEQEESALSGRSYTYDPAGRRDPFRSLLVRPEQRAAGSRPPGIAGVSVDDIVLQGIWKTQAGYVAQIRGTDNKSYLLRPGDLLWDGEVTRIGPNEVTFRQNLNDPQSVKPFRDVTKQLNATIKQ
jgi:type IV pilus assembly protein PilP